VLNKRTPIEEPR